MAYTTFLANDAFPVEEQPASDVDCISWGPHNVLLVATRWRLLLYTGSLVQPAATLTLRHHPLCYRAVTSSADLVMGAKWSPALAPEAHYPAEARVCVRTAGNFVVYRVARVGADGHVRASAGIGIGTNFHPRELEAVPDTLRGDAGGAAETEEVEDMDTAVDTRRAAATSRRGRPPGRRAPLAVKPVGPRRAGRARRRADTSSDSSESTSEDELSEEEQMLLSATVAAARDVAGGPGTKRGRQGRSRAGVEAQTSPPDPAAAPGAQASSKAKDAAPLPDARVWHTVVDYHWLPDDLLVIVTTLGVHLVDFCNRREDESGPQVFVLPPPVYLFDEEDGLGAEVGPPACATVALVSSQVTAASDGRSGLPSQPPSLLLVASAFALRLFVVRAGVSGTCEATAQLAHVIDLPGLACVPACLCAILESVGGGGRQSPALVLDVRIAAVFHVLHGRVFVEVPRDGWAAGLPPRHTPTRLTWVPQSAPGLRHARGDVHYVRQFRVFSAASIAGAAPAMGEADEASSGETARGGEFLIYGVGLHHLVGYVARSGQSAVLFRCPLVAGAVETTSDAAVGVCGVAVHPSCTLGVLALQTGVYGGPALHLLPVAACDPCGFLHRLLELNGVTGESADARLGAAAGLAGNDRIGYLLDLWRRQTRVDFFAWERPLREHSQQEALRFCAEARRRFTSPPASGVAPALVEGVDAGVPLREAYDRLRVRYGVSLFLRFPMPDTLGGAVAMQLGHLLGDSGADSGGGGGSDKCLDSGAGWWLLLLLLWRRCPWDATPLYEIVLANAVVVLAKHARYANMALGPGECIWEECGGPGGAGAKEDVRARPAAGDPWTYSHTGALDYVSLYLEAHEETQRLCDSSGPSGDRGLAACLLGGGNAAAHLPRVAPWSHNAEWLDGLRGLVAACTGGRPVAVRPWFACAVCGAPQSAQLCGSTFACASRHTAAVAAGAAREVRGAAPAEVHVTLFSPKTFCPLSLLSSDAVLTRCVSCGFFDFAAGPCCRICGGLLQ